MEPEEAGEQEKGGCEDAGEAEKEGAAEAGEPASKRIEQLTRFLRQQQEVVYSRQTDIAKYFSPELQKVAKQCWAQIHPDISSAIEGKYAQVMEEWNVLSKLTELDRLQKNTSRATPAWRPTGIPQEDSASAEKMESSLSLPEFQSRLADAEERSCDLVRQLGEREAELARLGSDITSSLSSLQHITSSFPPPSTTPSS